MKLEPIVRCNYPVVEVYADGWRVKFISKPNSAVEVIGNQPDLNAFRDAFAVSLFPLPAIDALYVAACVAFDLANKECA